MSLRLKFNLVLAVVLLVAAAGAGVYVHRFLQQSAIEEVQHNSQIMMNAAMAIRDYTTELVKPHLDVTLAEKFLPQTVPAFAATETLRRLQSRFPGYEYKEAVLNPTNLRETRVRQKPRQGAATFGGLVDGPNIKGDVAQAIKEEMATLEAEPADPLTSERLSSSRREHAEQYFKLLREGK